MGGLAAARLKGATGRLETKHHALEVEIGTLWPEAQVLLSLGPNYLRHKRYLPDGYHIRQFKIISSEVN